MGRKITLLLLSIDMFIFEFAAVIRVFFDSDFWAQISRDFRVAEGSYWLNIKALCLELINQKCNGPPKVS